MNNITNGYYYNAFFYIKIDGYINIFNKDLEFIPGTKNYRDLSTFFHEYVHYMQDLTTTYGLINIDHTYCRLISILCRIKQNESKSVKFPIFIDDIQNAELKNQMLKNILGTYELWSFEPVKDIKIKSKLKFESDDDMSCYEFGEKYKDQVSPSIEIDIIYSSGEIKTKNFRFGVQAIRESMANLIENHIFPLDRIDKYIQYDIVEIICNNIPFIKKNKAIMVSLCDCSLMTTNPGYFFMLFVQEIVNTNYKIESSKDIYNFVYNKFGDTINDRYNSIIKTVNKTLTKAFPNDVKLFENLASFLNGCLETANIFRKNNYNYWGKIMEMSKKCAFYEFSNMIKEVDFTIIIDEYNNYYTNYKNGQNILVLPTYFSLNSIVNNVDYFNKVNRFQCENYHLCLNMSGVKTNENCFTSPWKRCEKDSTTDYVCAFGALWNAWNLDGKELVSN